MNRDAEVSSPEDRVIYLVRHGQTEWNVAGRMQGHLDSPLTEAGRGHARAVAEVLATTLATVLPRGSLPRIEASPLGRAQATAKLICERLGIDPTTVSTDGRLAEHDLGDWAGLTPLEIDERFPDGRAARRRNHWTYVVPGGESYELALDRAKAWLGAERPARITIAVTHEMMSRTIQGAYLGLAPDAILALDHPHDRVIRLAGGRSEAIAG